MAFTIDMDSLDVRELRRSGLRGQGARGTRRLASGTWLSLESAGGRLEVECHGKRVAIDLRWSRCNFGGQRPWFRCPAEPCGGRVAILYLVGGIIACRRCHQLT